MFGITAAKRNALRCELRFKHENSRSLPDPCGDRLASNLKVPVLIIPESLMGEGVSFL